MRLHVDKTTISETSGKRGNRLKALSSFRESKCTFSRTSMEHFLWLSPTVKTVIEFYPPRVFSCWRRNILVPTNTPQMIPCNKAKYQGFQTTHHQSDPKNPLA